MARLGPFRNGRRALAALDAGPKGRREEEEKIPPIISLLSSPSSPKAKHWIAEAGKGRGRHQGFGQNPLLYPLLAIRVRESPRK